MATRIKSESSMSPVVFHATNLDSTLKILTNDEFLLSTSIGTTADDELQNGKLYYFSTTRHRLGKFHKYKGNEFVLLKLDGKKLNERYKSQPVDYWGEDFRKANKGDYEAEDRLFHNQPNIEKARKYILQIDILSTELSHPERIRSLLILCKKYKIPCYIYNDEKSFGHPTKAIHIDFNLLKNVEKVEPYNRWKYLDRSRKVENREARKYRSDYLWNMQELVFKNKWDKLSKDAQSEIYDMVYDLFNEKFTSFKNYVHNDKSNRTNTEKLTKLMGFVKAKTLRELYDFVLKKWTPVIKEGREI